ncbi:MAG: multidrug efflux protein [Methanoregula sp. PtaU1.Bin051]|nr:MAG: multidrug efflux protein [Methanoregula sp. PtaU1.Bin051]
MTDINELTEGDLFKGLIAVALPIVLSNLLQSVLEMVDLYFVGRLGADAIAGVAMAMTFIFVLATFIIGLATALTAFIARHYGAGEYEKIGIVLEHGLVIGGILSLLLAVFGFLFARPFLLLIGAGPHVAALGGAYLTVLCIGIFTMIESWMIISSFQACGNSRTPMLIMVMVNVLNIALNPLLIFGWKMIPAFGVAGSALATILSRGFGLFVFLWILNRPSSPIEMARIGKIDLSLIRRILLIGIPDSIQAGLRSSTFLVMMAVVAAYGTAAVSGYGIANRLELVALMPGFAIATATAVIVGQNLGAGQPDRAARGVKLSLILYGAIMAAVSLIYTVFAPQLIGFFDPTMESEAAGVSYFRSVAPFYIVLGSAVVLSFALNGAGDTRKPMYATLFAMVLLQIPLALILPGLLGIGIYGVWLAMITGIVVQAGLLAWMFAGGGWKKVTL